MELQYWQSKFEARLRDNHSGHDAAHDIFSFSSRLDDITKVEHGCDRRLAGGAGGVLLPRSRQFAEESSRSSSFVGTGSPETRRVLMRDFPDFPQQRLPAVCHAIEAHSFSAKIVPETLEAKIVQDADRLEALGAIGLARVFAVSGTLGVALFDAEDPFARQRSLDDKQYALDHFQTKLLTLPLTMQTEHGRHLAQHNADFLLTYMAKLECGVKRRI